MHLYIMLLASHLPNPWTSCPRGSMYSGKGTSRCICVTGSSVRPIGGRAQTNSGSWPVRSSSQGGVTASSSRKPSPLPLLLPLATRGGPSCSVQPRPRRPVAGAQAYPTRGRHPPERSHGAISSGESSRATTPKKHNTSSDRPSLFFLGVAISQLAWRKTLAFG